MTAKYNQLSQQGSILQSLSYPKKDWLAGPANPSLGMTTTTEYDTEYDTDYRI